MVPQMDGPMALQRRYPRYQSPSDALYKLYRPRLTNFTGEPGWTPLPKGAFSVRKYAPLLPTSESPEKSDPDGHVVPAVRLLSPAMRVRCHLSEGAPESV